jgi:hypothetical protein
VEELEIREEVAPVVGPESLLLIKGYDGRGSRILDTRMQFSGG